MELGLVYDAMESLTQIVYLMCMKYDDCKTDDVWGQFLSNLEQARRILDWCLRGGAQHCTLSVSIAINNLSKELTSIEKKIRSKSVSVRLFRGKANFGEYDERVQTLLRAFNAASDEMEARASTEGSVRQGEVSVQRTSQEMPRTDAAARLEGKQTPRNKVKNLDVVRASSKKSDSSDKSAKNVLDPAKVEVGLPSLRLEGEMSAARTSVEMPRLDALKVGKGGT
mmetsp:Transcript_987/g.1819  ORF Transcript_987/g.1819 Transcript_987/m.1819 type:complete len:225 (-) Transcript_987:434-1108(-)|eukprot:CAMPEP_0196663684 /NCGR_PEP_ID=MMETSP1086-20130531/53809_1 /TAXON_ID=77921 /ORGANISM="Cyanoptyche  gloeocystis , Strain SAG4.97" /LENGTH=224 /DNA_ID=CAMNT_0041999599 /DNA_START=40 /DNA_END=714 /DNA_ORIENTATION=-